MPGGAEGTVRVDLGVAVDSGFAVDLELEVDLGGSSSLRG